jgi:hypothetical protein
MSKAYLSTRVMPHASCDHLRIGRVITDPSSLSRPYLEFQRKSVSRANGLQGTALTVFVEPSGPMTSRPIPVSIAGNGPVEYGFDGPGGPCARCSLWAPVRLLEAWKRLVPAASLTRVRKLAADREAVEDDLLCHRFPETAEKEPPTPKR